MKNTTIDFIVGRIKLNNIGTAIRMIDDNKDKIDKNYSMLSFNIKCALSSGKSLSKIASAVKIMLESADKSKQEIITATRTADVILNY